MLGARRDDAAISASANDEAINASENALKAPVWNDTSSRSEALSGHAPPFMAEAMQSPMP